MPEFIMIDLKAQESFQNTIFYPVVINVCVANFRELFGQSRTGLRIIIFSYLLQFQIQYIEFYFNEFYNEFKIVCSFKITALF